MEKRAQKMSGMSRLFEGLRPAALLEKAPFFSDPGFKGLMDELRESDDTARAILLGTGSAVKNIKHVGDASKLDSDNLSVSELLEKARTAIDRREYMTAVSYLGRFKQKVVLASDQLKKSKDDIEHLNSEFFIGDLDDEVKKNLRDLDKTIKTRKAALATLTGFNKEAASLSSYFVNLFTTRGRALRRWENKNAKEISKIKNVIENMYSNSERMMNTITDTFANLASARSARDISTYASLANSFNARVSNYNNLFNNYYEGNIRKLIRLLPEESKAEMAEEAGVPEEVITTTASEPVEDPTLRPPSPEVIAFQQKTSNQIADLQSRISMLTRLTEGLEDTKKEKDEDISALVNRINELESASQKLAQAGFAINTATASTEIPDILTKVDSATENAKIAAQNAVQTLSDSNVTGISPNGELEPDAANEVDDVARLATNEDNTIPSGSDNLENGDNGQGSIDIEEQSVSPNTTTPTNVPPSLESEVHIQPPVADISTEDSNIKVKLPKIIDEGKLKLFRNGVDKKISSIIPDSKSKGIGSKVRLDLLDKFDKIVDNRDNFIIEKIEGNQSDFDISLVVNRLFRELLSNNDKSTSDLIKYIKDSGGFDNIHRQLSNIISTNIDNILKNNKQSENPIVVNEFFTKQLEVPPSSSMMAEVDESSAKPDTSQLKISDRLNSIRVNFINFVNYICPDDGNAHHESEGIKEYIVNWYNEFTKNAENENKLLQRTVTDEQMNEDLLFASVNYLLRNNQDFRNLIKLYNNKSDEGISPELYYVVDKFRGGDGSNESEKGDKWLNDLGDLAPKLDNEEITKKDTFTDYCLDKIAGLPNISKDGDFAIFTYLGLVLRNFEKSERDDIKSLLENKGKNPEQLFTKIINTIINTSNGKNNASKIIDLIKQSILFAEQNNTTIDDVFKPIVNLIKPITTDESTKNEGKDSSVSDVSGDSDSSGVANIQGEFSSKEINDYYNHLTDEKKNHLNSIEGKGGISDDPNTIKKVKEYLLSIALNPTISKLDKPSLITEATNWNLSGEDDKYNINIEDENVKKERSVKLFSKLSGIYGGIRMPSTAKNIIENSIKEFETYSKSKGYSNGPARVISDKIVKEYTKSLHQLYGKSDTNQILGDSYLKEPLQKRYDDIVEGLLDSDTTFTNNWNIVHKTDIEATTASKHGQFVKVIESMANEPTSVLIKYISKYANLISNMDPKIADKLNTIIGNE